MATIKEEVLNVKEELKEAKKQVTQNSFAVEMLREEKERSEKLNNAVKRLFTIWVITFLAFIGLLGYTIWLLNDISVVETTETSENTYDMSTENGNNNYVGGDNNGEITNN